MTCGFGGMFPGHSFYVRDPYSADETDALLALYLKLDTSNDPLAGLLVSQTIEPDLDYTVQFRALGGTDKRWNGIYVKNLIDGAHTISVATINTHVTNSTGSDHSFIDQDVTTTSTPEFEGATLTEDLDMGGNDIRNVASVNAKRVFAVEGDGSWNMSSDAGILYGTVESAGHIEVGGIADAEGAFAGGHAEGTIEALNRGSIALGVTSADAVISSSGAGSFAQGSAAGDGSINSTSNGSFAQGWAIGGSINATNAGAFAIGSTGNDNIIASGIGSFAQGNSGTNDIIASATNSVQHGPGENSTANSLQVGSGVMLKANGEIISKAGRIVNTTRLTGTTTLNNTHHHVFCDTDGGAFPVNLPAGVDGQTYRIANTGTSGNAVTLVPNGAELLNGFNASEKIFDSEKMILTYETTEGWR